jgi:hypothetical protein
MCSCAPSAGCTACYKYHKSINLARCVRQAALLLCVCLPQTYSKPCPRQAPTDKQLAARATPTSHVKVAADQQLPYTFLVPDSPTPGRCNAYLPNGPTTLSRFLWVVDYFVQSGFYVLVSALEEDTTGALGDCAVQQGTATI